MDGGARRARAVLPHLLGRGLALRAVTIEAAYSWRLEHELGSITPGKLATFTVLDADPYEIDPTDLRDVPVVGTVFEGRWFPVPEHHRRDLVGHAPSLVALPGSNGQAACVAEHHEGAGCSCTVARHLARAWRDVDAGHDVA